MELKKRNLDGFYEINTESFRDERGFLARMYDEENFKKLGLNTNWTQESHSFTRKKYTLRGIHYQLPPFAERKLIRLIKGKMLWIVVDLRKNSETFGQWESTILVENESKSLYAQRGFGHGCTALADNSDIVVSSDNFYSKENGGGIIWNDKDLAIDWNLNGHKPFLSVEHSKYPTFRYFKEKYIGL